MDAAILQFPPINIWILSLSQNSPEILKDWDFTAIPKRFLAPHRTNPAIKVLCTQRVSHTWLLKVVTQQRYPNFRRRRCFLYYALRFPKYFMKNFHIELSKISSIDHFPNDVIDDMMHTLFPKRAMLLATNGIAFRTWEQCMLWDFASHHVEAKVVSRWISIEMT